MRKPTQWIRQPQESDNDYFFDGKLLVTRTVSETLYPDEILNIIWQVQEAVHKHSGIDYIQVFKNEEDEKIFCIDQLSKSMKENDHTPEEVKEYNYWTIMFSHEY